MKTRIHHSIVVLNKKESSTMKQKIVAAVVQGMLPYLNNAQTKKLQEVLLHALWDYDIAFLMAKRRNKSKIF